MALKQPKIAINQPAPIFIENQWFDSPQAYTAFCLNRAAKMTKTEKNTFFVERMKKRMTFGLGTVFKDMGFYELIDKTEK